MDLTSDGIPIRIVRLFEARGMHLGTRNPSISILISDGQDEFAAIQEAYRRLDARRGLNMETRAYPLCHDGETY